MYTCSGDRVYFRSRQAPQTAKKSAATDEMIYMGEEQNGYVKVESGSGSGWINKILVAKLTS